MATSTDFSILFIDDEEQARKYFKRAFDRDFNIFTAESVEDAKKVLEHHSDEIGVLITDQRMPGAHGVVLLNFAKENYPHIVRLLTTAYSDLEDAIDAVNSGEILRYIVKPWDIKALKMELKHALMFYYMRSERDQLVREKMNVWQRMTELNRVRDLLVMAGSFSHLEHSMQGIRSLLLQALVTVDLFSDERSLDMWGLLEEEVTRMLALVDSIKSATRVVDPQIMEVSIGELLPALASGTKHTAKLQIESQNDWPRVEGCPELLSRLFESLGNYFATVLGQSELEIKITGKKQGNMLVLGIHPEIKNQSDTCQFTVNKALLVAFFIVAHHGGEIMLDKRNPPGVELRLPLGDDTVFTVTENDFWLDQILSLYEVKPVE